MFPERELMLERLTTGTVVTGTLPRNGFWPLDFKRIQKEMKPLDQVKVPFTKEYLEEMKGKVKN